MLIIYCINLLSFVNLISSPNFSQDVTNCQDFVNSNRSTISGVGVGSFDAPRSALDCVASSTQDPRTTPLGNRKWERKQSVLISAY